MAVSTLVYPHESQTPADDVRHVREITEPKKTTREVQMDSFYENNKAEQKRDPDLCVI